MMIASWCRRKNDCSVVLLYQQKSGDGNDDDYRVSERWKNCFFVFVFMSSSNEYDGDGISWTSTERWRIRRVMTYGRVCSLLRWAVCD